MADYIHAAAAPMTNVATHPRMMSGRLGEAKALLMTGNTSSVTQELPSDHVNQTRGILVLAERSAYGAGERVPIARVGIFADRSYSPDDPACVGESQDDDLRSNEGEHHGCDTLRSIQQCRLAIQPASKLAAGRPHDFF
jgi:hypothetical protein